MAKKETEVKQLPISPPALTDEGQESQLISLAYRAAKQKLEDGTASSELICQLVKMGAAKSKLEMEILEKQNELIQAKTENLKSAQRIEELYAEAISAFKDYNGEPVEIDEEDIEDE